MIFVQAKEFLTQSKAIDFAFDADGQHLATDIPKIIIALKDGYDLVLGIRNKFQGLQRSYN